MWCFDIQTMNEAEKTKQGNFFLKLDTKNDAECTFSRTFHMVELYSDERVFFTHWSSETNLHKKFKPYNYKMALVGKKKM